MSKQTTAKARIVYYHRHENGVLERGRGALVERSELDQFAFEERLRGYPESVVRWRQKAGETHGVAFK